MYETNACGHNSKAFNDVRVVLVYANCNVSYVKHVDMLEMKTSIVNDVYF